MGDEEGGVDYTGFYRVYETGGGKFFIIIETIFFLR
jgi:hypothetical protein